jgi:1-deoxy-D-xylulose-5-phosphate reductoisomerase
MKAEDALNHPNWSMGSRITIDSATMVNKAFEVIEAHYLFDVPYGKIEPVIHPQSLIHSMVEYQDGSIIAELAASDMRIPIQYALAYPERINTDLPRLSLEKLSKLSFEPLDMMRYPAFGVVLKAGIRGDTAPAAVNAADEVLVRRFLQGEIRFTDIAMGLRKILDSWLAREGKASGNKLTLARIMSTDSWARDEAAALNFQS